MTCITSLFETSQSLFWASFGLVDLLTFELSGIKSFTRFWALLMFGSYSVINVIVLLNMLIAMMSNSYQIISERSDAEWKFARSKLWISYFDDDDALPPPFNIMPQPNYVLKKMGIGKEKVTTASFKSKSKEREKEKHEYVMRLLVRRYVTAEQRKRDDFGITEDDVMEIRQDISSLRYELIDILRKNGMKAPEIKIQDTQVSGKKGKIMERRLLKDFHIGIVEGLVSEMQQNPVEPKNVFGQIAKVIGRRTTSKKKDWNALVRKNTTVSNPIGSREEAEETMKKRQSLRKHILSNAETPVKIEDEKLLEYNPKLSEVPRTARLAYAKFMTKKIEQDFKSEIDEKKTPGSRNDSKKGSVTFKGPAKQSSTTSKSSLKTSTDAKTTETLISKDKEGSLKRIMALPSLPESGLTPDQSRSSTPAPKLLEETKKPDSKDTTTTDINLDPTKPLSPSKVIDKKSDTQPGLKTDESKKLDKENKQKPPDDSTNKDTKITIEKPVESTAKQPEIKRGESKKLAAPQPPKKSDLEVKSPAKTKPPEVVVPKEEEDNLPPPSMRSKLTGQKRTGWI